MKRRDFLSAIVGATAWPLAARAQKPTMSVVGILITTSAEGVAHLIAAFQRGLAEAGYVEGKNITIEYRFGNFNMARLSELAADLVRHKVNVLFAPTPEYGGAAQSTTTHD